MSFDPDHVDSDRSAGSVSVLDRDAYQAIVRRLLVSPLLTDEPHLAAVRRFEPELQIDFDALARYRLEVSPSCARLIKRPLRIDASSPLRRTNTDRTPFDRRRYAYLCLVVAALGRSGVQTTISTIADSLRRRAADIAHIDFDPDVAAHRRALVDVLGWLESQRALSVADGSSQAWMNDVADGDALYDVERETVHHLFHPAMILQGVGSVADLLVEHYADARESQRLRRRQRLIRRLLEQPVVLHADLPHDEREYLRREAASIAGEVEAFTGCPVERRAEGLALIDVAGRMTDKRFPASKTVSWAALLLLDRMLSARARRPLIELPSHEADSTALIDALDGVRPATDHASVDGTIRSIGDWLAVDDDTTGQAVSRFDGEPDPASARPDQTKAPLYDHAWLRRTVGTIGREHAGPFRADLVEDPDRLTRLTVAELADFDLVRPVGEGVVLLPVAARYRPEITVARPEPSGQLSLT